MERCVKACQGLENRDLEILVLPDEQITFAPQLCRPHPVRVVPTGAVNPARKRDEAIHEARGEILAFIDDDAFPAARWVSAALGLFQDPAVAAVAGPAVTPPGDSFMEKAGGAVYSSLLVSGPYRYRYEPQPRRRVDDFPSCNFFIRARVFADLGGFCTDFWPGEDTKLCLDLKQRGMTMIYDPSVLVYHHRRRLFLPHLAQISRYALHRGFFAKRFPETSCRLAYFLPSGLLFFWAAGPFVAWLPPAAALSWKTLAFCYLGAVLLASLAESLRTGCRPVAKAALPLPVFAGIIMTHLTYGVYFLKGLLTRSLRTKK